MNGTVLSLHVVMQHGERPRPVSEVRALVGHGLQGDMHGKTKPHSRRQVLLVDRTTLVTMGLEPGALREQITVDFEPLETLGPGTQLRIGEVTLELSGPCEPCTHIGALNGVADPVQFQQSLVGRRGQVARVTAVEGDGRIRVGDSIITLSTGPR